MWIVIPLIIVAIIGIAIYVHKKDPGTKVLQSYQMIDNMWSWTKDDTMYHRFRSFEPQIKTALGECYSNMKNIPGYKKKAKVFDIFAMFQCFALSYILVLNLQPYFSSYTSDQVSKVLAQVLAEQGYLGDNGPQSFNSIDIMIANKDAIVYATQRRLP